MNESEFQQKVLGSIGQVEKTTETLLKNYDNLTAETKKAMEELTTVKNSQQSQGEALQAIQKLQAGLAREQRMAFGNPIQRVSRDPGLRRLFVATMIATLGSEVRSKAHPEIQAVLKDLDTGNTPGSTYIDNAELERELYDALLTFGAFRTLNVRSIGTKSVDLRLKTARALAVFVDEAGGITPDSAKAGSKANIIAKKIGVLLNASTELLEDDVSGVVEDIMNDFMEAMAYRIDYAAFAADGSADATNGGFTGMFNGGTAVTADATRTSVAATKYTDWLKCLTGIDAAVLQRQARWWLHPTQLARALSVQDLNGRPIFQTAIEAPSFGAVGTIFGYPVTLVGVAPSEDGASKKIAAFGDPNAVAVRVRRQMTFDRSEHFAFDTEEITFRGTTRVATKVRLATAITVLNTPAS